MQHLVVSTQFELAVNARMEQNKFLTCIESAVRCMELGTIRDNLLKTTVTDDGLIEGQGNDDVVLESLFLAVHMDFPSLSDELRERHAHHQHFENVSCTENDCQETVKVDSDSNRKNSRLPHPHCSDAVRTNQIHGEKSSTLEIKDTEHILDQLKDVFSHFFPPKSAILFSRIVI